jgi:hypothetical protein
MKEDPRIDNPMINFIEGKINLSEKILSISSDYEHLKNLAEMD